MKSALFLLGFILFGFSAFCQGGLLVRNVKTGETRLYKKNSRISYILFQEEDYTTASIRSLLDSSVVLGKDTVLLKNIACIRKKSPGHNITRIIGMPLMLVGSILMGDGIAGMISNNESNSGTRLFLLGTGVFAIGYLPYLFEKKDLSVGFKGEWTLEICRKCI